MKLNKHFLCCYQWSDAQRAEAVSERSAEGIIQCPGGWTRTPGTKGRSGVMSVTQLRLKNSNHFFFPASSKLNSNHWTFHSRRAFLWMTLHFIVIRTFADDSWESLLTFPVLLLCSVCRPNPQGPVCLHGSVVFPWRGPVARPALWEHAEDKDARGLHWQVGHRCREYKPPCHDDV